MHCQAEGEGGGGGARDLTPEKTLGRSPWGSQGALVSHVHADDICRGHVHALTGYKCSQKGFWMAGNVTCLTYRNTLTGYAALI
jgi:hypothetical protein